MPKLATSKRRLLLDPIAIDGRNWYYEEPKALVLVHEVYDDDDKFIRTDQISIPWHRLADSVSRKFGTTFPRRGHKRRRTRTTNH